jgi:hypothetical protein
MKNEHNISAARWELIASAERVWRAIMIAGVTSGAGLRAFTQNG